MRYFELIKPVNNQEDEDGYTIYPADKIVGKNKKKQDTRIRNNPVSMDFNAAKSLFRNFTLSAAITD